MNQPADLLARKHLFDGMQTLAAEASRQDAYDGLPFAMDQYIDGMQPISLADGRLVTLPDQYILEAGPPVLMTSRLDLDRCVSVPAMNISEAGTLRRLAGQAGLQLRDFYDKPTATTLDLSQIGFIFNTMMWLQPEPQHLPRRPILLPRFMVMNSLVGTPHDSLISAFGHEMDHWNFHLHHLPAVQGGNLPVTSTLAVLALSEKHAYAASRMIYRNLGYSAVAGSIEEIAEPYLAKDPTQSEEIFVDMQARQRTANPGRPNNSTALAQTVEVIAHLFGSPVEQVTNDEICALYTIGCLD